MFGNARGDISTDQWDEGRHFDAAPRRSHGEDDGPLYFADREEAR